MYKAYIIIFCSLIVLLTACRKESGPATLANGSISFQSAGKDTLETPLSILSDTTLVIGLKATLSGNASSSDHWVNFAVDTTKIAEFRARYGDAVLLPVKSYFFYKPMTHLPPGALISDSAQLNIVQQTKLVEYTTYVLPVVIQSVDGNTDGPATSKVLYYVFKTGKPLFINKIGWTIENYSSYFNAFVPKNILDDNNRTTYWTSNITQHMPQWITINFNREVKFTALTYYIPPLLGYPAQGGYPTSIQIETSMDGENWVNNGVFTGQIEVDNNNVSLNKQTLDLGGLTTARYLRFTSLASVKYAKAYDAIFISDISLVP